MRFRSLLLIIILLAGLLTLKFAFFPAPKEGGKTGVSPSKGVKKGLLVDVLQVQTVSTRHTVTATGSLVPYEQVLLQPETGGKITRLYFKEGKDVRKGQLLYTINSKDLVYGLQKLLAGLRLAQENEERQKKLLEIGAVSKQDYENAQNALRTFRADIGASRAVIEKAGYRAPFSGRIGLRYVSEGAEVSTASKIATLEQISRLKLDFSIPGQYAGQVRTGDQIKFSVQGSATAQLARVSAIEPQIDPSTRTLKVRAEFNNEGLKLLPGAFANVQLTLKESPAMLVPTQAIVPVLKGETVFLVRGGRVRQIPVTTGERTDQQIEVKGLKDGDSVVTSGLLTLKPGDRIKVKRNNTQ